MSLLRLLPLLCVGGDDDGGDYCGDDDVGDDCGGGEMQDRCCAEVFQGGKTNRRRSCIPCSWMVNHHHHW